jgi:1-phosphofructokinase family hexose kinase
VILSAGLTPAWQHVLVIDSFRSGEVNRAREAHWCASGKVLNAGVAAHLLGCPSLTLSTGGGHTLAEMDRNLDELGVPRRWVKTQATTRVCTTILDQSTGTITELVENGRPLRQEELQEFRRAFGKEASRADLALLMGSLPAGTPAAYYRELLEQATCPTIADFRGEGLLAVLDLKPLVVKPNREELAATLGRPLATDAELVEAMQSLNRRGAQWVIITQGTSAAWVTSLGQVYRVYPLKLEKIVNPIGCGDVMTAAIARATLEGRDMLTAIRHGVAAAAANARHPLPGRFDPASIEAEAEQVRVEEGTGG